MTVVDTSFLVALTNPSDKFHNAAKSVNLYRHTLRVPHEILVEFVSYLLHRAPSSDAAKAFERLLEGPFVIAPAASTETLASALAHGKRLQEFARRRTIEPLTVQDILVCDLARRQHDGVLTFDQSMQQHIEDGQFPGARIAR